MFVLSRFMSCTVSIRHSCSSSGTSASSSSEVSCGVSPSAVSLDAMVPPVAIMRMCFMSVFHFLPVIERRKAPLELRRRIILAHVRKLSAARVAEREGKDFFGVGVYNVPHGG